MPRPASPSTALRVWCVGDAAIRPAAQAFAADLGADFIDTSTPGATVEEVWGVQIHVDAVRTQWQYAGPVVVVLYLELPAYDSENTVHQILRRLPADRMLLAIVGDEEANTMDGFTHEGGPWLQVAVPETLDPESLRALLHAMYEAD